MASKSIARQTQISTEMHFSFETEKSDNGKYDTYTKSKANNARALHELAGSDEAARVLSSVLHQHTIRDLVRGSRMANGKEIVYRAVPSKLDDVRVYTSDKMYEKYKPDQLVAARIHVKKTDTGDFLVVVSFPFFANSVENMLVDPDNPTANPAVDEPQKPCRALKVELSGTFTISGEEAKKGKLKLLSEDLVQNVYGQIRSKP